MLGQAGLERTRANLGYPRRPVALEAIEEALLRSSNPIRLEDDLTLLEVRLG